MASLEFEGAIDNINEIHLKYISKIIEERGYNDNKVNIEDLGEIGDNYIANVKRIIFKDSYGKPFKMIAKIAPSNEQMRLAANTHNLFVNEHIMYTKVMPKFRQLQQSAHVPDSDILKFAECYGSIIDAPNELILLEDLKESNFEMLDRFKPLSDDCVKAVLKNLAILHSVSFVVKNKEPDTFEDLKNGLYDMWSNTLPESEPYFGFLGKTALSLVSGNEERIATLKRVDVSKVGAMSRQLKTDTETKYTVIQQGDTWTNNMMFKFDNDTLLDMIMIDYQISTEKSPVYDILYMVLNCTDHESRLQNFHNWITYYHEELDKSLSNYGLKASYVYPKDQLDVDLKRYGKLMFSICLVLSRVMTMKKEDAAKLKSVMETSGKADFSEIPSSVKETDVDKIFKTKVEGLIDTCAEFGLL